MRLILAMYVEVETPPPAIRGFVVWLNRDGFPTRLIFWSPKRIIDLQPGDQNRHNGKRYKVASVKPFLEHANTSADFLREQGRTDGFLMP